MLNVSSEHSFKTRHFHCAKRFIDYLCAINHGGEFGKSFWKYTQKGWS